MASRHRARRSESRGWRRGRWLAGVSAVALAGATALALAPPASAAPKSNYHPGTDRATFSVLGVSDSNCPIDVGGTDIWIKPDDKIRFDSSLVGLDLGALHLGGLLSGVAGLNVTAVIDNSTQLHVRAGHATTLSDADVLSPGTHTLAWKVDSLGVLGGTLNVPLRVAALDTGAKLSWTGTIHVSDNAARCGVALSAPKVDVSVGPVKVDTGTQADVTVPGPGTSAPSDGKDSPTPSEPSHEPGTTAPETGHSSPHPSPPDSGSTTPRSRSSHASTQQSNTSSPATSSSPDSSAPSSTHIGGGGGGFGNALPDLGVLLTGGDAHGSGTQNGTVPSGKPSASRSNVADASQHSEAVDLGGDKPVAPQMPVVLAIIAIIALSLVTATYARLYLLRRDG